MRKAVIRATVAVLAVGLMAAMPAQAWSKPLSGCSGDDCWPAYSYRDRDTDVKSIQYLLRANGIVANAQPITAYFGLTTERNVEIIQHNNGLKVTGVVDAGTWWSLASSYPDYPSNYGDRGAAVRAVQLQLAERYGYDLPVTGYYGQQTSAAVEDFQHQQGLQASGIVDACTWQSLVSAR